ncbi:unnamed protein product [Brassicogethes aeneus]|uniref:Uncharacterized protein n=1 Tax=Brassicogethes aeneus TaxID=1431903 RepID=A0A9P0FGB9_BRAAE|nr:unnamed protein product [Brassicogethes aeneus]
MAPKTQNALELCLALAEQERLITPIKESTKLAYFSGIFTFAGGILYGPLGFLSGAFLGFIASLLFLNHKTDEVFKDTMVGSVIVTVVTCICGLYFRQNGLLMGAVISTVLICGYSLPQFKPAKYIIETELSADEKYMLGRDAQSILASLNINDVSLLLMIVSKCPDIKQALMNRISYLLRKKLKNRK